MIIKKMTASFGCLENETMELKPGLNIISMPNGSGKSTWCAFIRCMLYGIDSAQREKGGVKPDKLKYAPWSGAPMSGSMDIEHEGRAITLSRSTKSAAAPFREFSAVYSGSADKVAALSGKDAGETLTGMPRTVFESSVFVRQSGLSVQNSPELEKRINAIISTGTDEGCSYTDADAQLRAWQRKRRHNNSGAIPAAEAELAELQRSIDSEKLTVQLIEQLDGHIERARHEAAQAQQQRREEAVRRREEKLQQLNLARDREEKARQALAEAEAAESALRNEIEKSIFEGKKPEDVESQLGGELEEYARRDKARLPRFVIFGLLALGLAALLVVGKLDFRWLYIPGALILGAAAGCAVLWRYRDNHYIGWGKMLEGKYGSADAAVLQGYMQLYRSKWDALKSAEAAGEQSKEALEAARAELERAERSLIRPETENYDVRGELEQLLQRRAQLEGRLAATGDPMVLKSEKYDLQQRLSGLQEQYEALALAISTLREANDEMQQRFSPRLGQRASEIMSRLTGGSYDSLSFDRSLSAEAARPRDMVSHSAAFLSQGSLDQLYLALRLAICELALPEGSSCPLVLDDALVNFDDERMALAMELLREIARDRQVIVFSCHDREALWLEKQHSEN